MEETSSITLVQHTQKCLWKQNLFLLTTKEEQSWRQKCKKKRWLEEDDISSKVFHRNVTSMKWKSAIAEILSTQGRSLVNENEIVLEFVLLHTLTYKGQYPHQISPQSWLEPNRSTTSNIPWGCFYRGRGREGDIAPGLRQNSKTWWFCLKISLKMLEHFECRYHESVPRCEIINASLNETYIYLIAKWKDVLSQIFNPQVLRLNNTKS